MSQERIQELETQVRYHSDLYYNGMPEITDAEFDEMVDELTELAPDSPALAEVGAIPAWGRKVKHPFLMGSLSKKTKVPKLLEWYEDVPTSDMPNPKVLVCSPKMDGLAVRLRYVEGDLVEAATRGDGEVGQDILENVKQIKTIPQKMDGEFTGEVRGEVYMLKSVFEELNEELASEGKKLLANPRNGAAGGLLQKDAAETGKKRLSFMAYSIKADEDTGGSEMSHERSSEHLGFGLGFDYVKWEVVELKHLDAYLLNWETNRRPELPYNIDGLVFAVDSFEEQEEAGWNGKRPRGKVAWKFPAEQREATALGVPWSVGRTGKLTPVLRIEPTKIDGSTVSNVTLGSAARFDELALGRGDKVLVEKAGDIIPQVVRVTWRPLKNKKIEKPETCPSCGSTVVLEGAHLFCRNAACPAQLCRRVRHWLDTMDVKGAGPSIVSSMCELGIVKELSDLYYLTPEDLEVATGSSKVAEKIINEVMTKSQMPLWKFMSGLGVPSLGRTASKTIAKKYSSVTEAVEADVSGLSALSGIGETTATQIINGLIAMTCDIEALERVLEIEEPVTSGPLLGLTFCITGKLSRDKKLVAADIEAAGGELVQASSPAWLEPILPPARDGILPAP